LQENDVRGRHAWSSLDDHELADGEEPSLYRQLYAVAAEAWVEVGYLDHYVGVPAEDEVLAAWYGLSFAQQQVHGRRALEPVEVPDPEGFTVRIGGQDGLGLALQHDLVMFGQQASASSQAG